MPKLMLLLQQYGLLILFANVLLEQVGLPIPAFPILIVSGALAANGQMVWAECLIVSLLACMLSDYIWFSAGRHYGKKILKLLCRISISPDYCVSQTEDTFNRWGPKSLIVSKFIPGFSTIAPPLAGAMGTKRKTFAIFSLSGGVLWVTTGLTLGAVFHNSIDRVMDLLSTMGVTALIVIGSVLALIIGVKFYERRRFYKTLRMARITVDELSDMIEAGHKPVIVDARSRTAQQLEAPIPGALLYNRDAPDDVFINVSKSFPIIVYCSCPNEATAAVVAKQLINHGFKEVRPLIGGLDAWNELVARSATGQNMEAQPG
jgi:membrane protein DedA with SNARE-associated domain/rhodanese-related sulfurtransferase